MEKTFTLNVDGSDHTITADPAMPLLYVLRNEIGKKGPKFGCGLAQCGACTVIQDGVAIRSCVVPIAAIHGKIRTLDGLGTATTRVATPLSSSRRTMFISLEGLFISPIARESGSHFCGGTLYGSQNGHVCATTAL